MAVVYLRPYTQGTCQLTPYGHTYNFECVNEAVLDYADYNYCGETAGLSDVMYMPTTGLGASAVIDNIIFNITGSCNYQFGVVNNYFLVYLGTTWYNGAVQSISVLTPTLTQTWATNPATSAAWTLSEVNSLVTAYQEQVPAGSLGGKIYQFYVTVTYHYPEPELGSTTISSATATSAHADSSIVSIGDSNVTERGFCWNTTGTPTTSDSKVYESGTFSAGAFDNDLTGLSANSTYYVRSYAINSYGTSYGAQTTFSNYQATVTTTGISSLGISMVVSGGNISNAGSFSVTARGVCWNTTGTPTISDSYTSDGTGTGSFTSSITGLLRNTVYYIRAYATNSAGTAYGNQVTFTSQPLRQTFVAIY